jgi:hypothetical protein
MSLSCSSKNIGNESHSNDTLNYLNLIYKNCSKPDILEIEKTENGYIEIEYLCDGKLFEVAINNNAIIYTETKAEIENIPIDKIQRKIEKQYSGWILDEISEINTSDTSFLKVELIKDGIEQNLYFTMDGKWFKMKSLNVNDELHLDKIGNYSSYKMVGYDLLQPDQTFDMPDILKEISGISVNNNKVYCIQDELGAIFEYDLTSEEIKNVHRFTDNGDFEDLTFNGDIAYILRSDGNIFQFSFKNTTKINQTILSLNSLNVEGLSYHDNYIYVACKDPQVNKSLNKRCIYRVKNENYTSPEMFLEIDIEEISQFIQKNFPEIMMKNFTFNPSAFAIHPITKESYILSSTDRVIAIFADLKLKNAIPLPANVYFKPEGLAFYPNGDLLISSEGDKKGLIKGSISLIKNR